MTPAEDAVDEEEEEDAPLPRAAAGLGDCEGDADAPPEGVCEGEAPTERVCVAVREGVGVPLLDAAAAAVVASVSGHDAAGRRGGFKPSLGASERESAPTRRHEVIGQHAGRVFVDGAVERVALRRAALTVSVPRTPRCTPARALACTYPRELQPEYVVPLEPHPV